MHYLLLVVTDRYRKQNHQTKDQKTPSFHLMTILFSWNINSQTFKTAFVFFLCCRIYSSLETLAIEQEVWVNACEPTLMKKIVYNIWKITLLLPSYAVWRNCIQPVQAQHTLLSQSSLSITTYLWCSAWS